MGAICGNFPPEFIDRIDEIIIFASTRFYEFQISFWAGVLTILPLLAYPLIEWCENDLRSLRSLGGEEVVPPNR